jgi:hypothetical protein
MEPYLAEHYISHLIVIGDADFAKSIEWNSPSQGRCLSIAPARTQTLMQEWSRRQRLKRTFGIPPRDPLQKTSALPRCAGALQWPPIGERLSFPGSTKFTP